MLTLIVADLWIIIGYIFLIASALSLYATWKRFFTVLSSKKVPLEDVEEDKSVKSKNKPRSYLRRSNRVHANFKHVKVR